MTLRFDTITFLSDFGRTDEFVGVVHSVIRSLCPAVQVIDLAHDLEPYDVRAASLLLARSAQHLVPGVVLAVVDPGVGTSRRAVAVEVGGGASVLVGPDNGLLAPAVAVCGGATAAVELTNAEHHLEAEGPTFAGRDVFAPVAAQLCNGVPLDDLGDRVDPVGLMPGLVPVSYDDGDDLVAQVLWVDRYGNAQLNLEADDVAELGPQVSLVLADHQRTARAAPAFADLDRGEIGLLVDSYGLLAIVLDKRSAAAELGLHAGSEVRLRRGEGPQGSTTPVRLGGRTDQ